MADLEDLDAIIETVVAPQAAEIDRAGTFPDNAIEALAQAGLLALTVPTEYGGRGQPVRTATQVVTRLATACSSTAMITTMHYSAVAVLAATGRAETLRDIVAGRHLSTLAFSESGSRSHFWAPLGHAQPVANGVEGDDWPDGAVRLDAEKTWITSASRASSYVWSSQPVRAAGPMTLWLVPAGTPGLRIGAPFDGLGLRGNDSRPVVAKEVLLPATAMLGSDGAGLDLAFAAALPWFLLLNAAASLGLMRAVTDETAAHLTGTHLRHLGRRLADQMSARAALARMRIASDRTASHLDSAVSAVESRHADAQLLVLAAKAGADESAAEVADLALNACGGAAFRKELGVERRFRDSRAARVMAPTTEALHEFVGRTLLGMPLLDGGQP